jgi:putative restriction endonuclease
MSTRTFGDIEGFPSGVFFRSREELSTAGVHRPLQAGISGSSKQGADSIVLSGGYEDDLDDGDTIIYTGHGGRDQTTGKQISDQLLERGNLALAYSCLHGLPVRVIRGFTHRSPLAPPAGYRYDGLYRVEDYWHTKGKSGHTIWRFRLTKITPATRKSRRTAEMQESYELTRRQPTMVVRIIRDTQQARRVKEFYDYHCQVCGTRLESSAGPYAEAAHIRPLGSPHDGPDSLDNLLCLCPNHHVLFDYGGFTIDDDFTLIGILGQLTVKSEHEISRDHLHYHRSHYYNGI